MNLIEIYFWFKEDGKNLKEEWKAIKCNIDDKVKHFNEYDLRLYYSCCMIFRVLDNFEVMDNFKKNSEYRDITMNHIYGMLKMYNKNNYIDCNEIGRVIDYIEHYRILDIIKVFVRFSIRNKLFEIDESTL